MDFDVQEGATQRSLFHFVDIAFIAAEGLLDLVNSLADADPGNDFIRLTRFDLNGQYGTNVALAPGLFQILGQTLRIDFGAQGIGGNRNFSDGFYLLEFDPAKDGQFNTQRSLHRLFRN